MKLKIRNNFLNILLGLLLVGIPSALVCRHYINTHRILIYFNMFIVRDVNGDFLKHTFEFYIKSQKQSCDTKFYW